MTAVMKLMHYWPSMLFGIWPVAMLFFYLKGIVTGVRLEYGPELLWLVAIASILSALVYWMQRNRLKLTAVETAKQRAELAIIIKNLTIQKEWTQIQLRQDLVVITTHPPFWSGSWGERITLIFKPGKVYINSICDPRKRVSLVSWGRNRRNVILVQEVIESSRSDGK